MFHVGQKVVCIKDGNWQRALLDPVDHYIPNRPVKGCIYSIRGILRIDHYEGLRLAELINPVRDFGIYGVMESAFVSSRFRPVRETNISIFTKLLDDVPLHVKERV